MNFSDNLLPASPGVRREKVWLLFQAQDFALIAVIAVIGKVTTGAGLQAY